MEQKQFEIALESLKTQNKSILEKIKKRSTLQKQKPTSMLDMDIKKDLESISSKIKSMLAEESQDKRNISLNESNRRLGIIHHWTKMISKIKKEFDEDIYKHLMKQNEQNLKQSNDIQAVYVEDLADQEVIQITREKLNRQDDMLDELHDLLTITKKTNEEIKSELDDHKPMLEHLDQNMDVVNNKIKAANKKIDKYDEKSGNCFILTMIWIQFVLMFIFIFGF